MLNTQTTPAGSKLNFDLAVKLIGDAIDEARPETAPCRLLTEATLFSIHVSLNRCVVSSTVDNLDVPVGGVDMAPYLTALVHSSLSAAVRVRPRLIPLGCWRLERQNLPAPLVSKGLMAEMIDIGRIRAGPIRVQQEIMRASERTNRVSTACRPARRFAAERKLCVRDPDHDRQGVFHTMMQFLQQQALQSLGGLVLRRRWLGPANVWY